MSALDEDNASRPPRRALHQNRRVRAVLLQAIFVLVLLWAGYEILANVRSNLEAQGIATGFDFLSQPAGFDVNQSLISYGPADSYRRLFLVGLLNTLLVSALGIVFATLLGFAIGFARLSNNWLVARLAGGYVELIRNLPLLFQLLFWYLAVLGSLPPPRESISIAGEIFLSNRGIVMPRLLFGAGTEYIAAAFALGLLVAGGIRVWARRRQAANGRQFPVLAAGFVAILGPPLIAMMVTGFPIAVEHPRLAGFNFVGGLRIIPEFAALLIGLVIYTAAFMAETVRSGILSVPKEQTDAAYSLGLPRGLAMRLVVMPQALRVIVPPLTSQYLNLTKNSSLAVGIGYPDLFAVFAGTALHQTGQAIEIIVITMATYLVISLATSFAMNLYNSRMRLMER